VSALLLVAHCKALEARGPIASPQRRAAGPRSTSIGPRRASINSDDPTATGSSTDTTSGPGTSHAGSVSIERSHRIDSEEFYRLLEGQLIDDANLFAEKLQEWEDYYNYHRPHGALQGQTPYERLRQKAQDPLS
jgi:hypothetical protein